MRAPRAIIGRESGRLIMAKELAVTGPQTLGLPEADYEFDTVHSEAPDQVTFDELNDTFVAEWLGHEIITFENKRKSGDGPNGGTMESFTQLKFRVLDQHYVINAGYDLLKAFIDITPDGMWTYLIPVKSIVRIQLMTLVDVGQNDPMKSYRVDVARNTGAK